MRRVPLAVLATIRMSPSAVTAGCTMGKPFHACSQSTLPLVGATLVGAGSAHQQDLRHSVDRCEMWRAVALAGRAGPAPLTGGEVVGDELAGRGDDDEIVDDQRETPVRDFRASVGRHVP